MTEADSRRLRDALLIQRNTLDEDELDRLLVVQAQRFTDALTEKVSTSAIEAYGSAARSLAREFGATVIDTANPAILEGIRATSIQVVEGTQSVIAQRLRSDLIQVLADNGGTGTTQAKVANSLDELQATTTRAFNSHSARALTIARTEVGKSGSAARFEQLKGLQAEGLLEGGRWATSGRHGANGTVRDSHQAMDGQRVDRIGDPFISGSGNRTLHPHAFGIAGEDINCECVLLGIPIDEEDDDE